MKRTTFKEREVNFIKVIKAIDSWCFPNGHQQRYSFTSHDLERVTGINSTVLGRYYMPVLIEMNIIVYLSLPKSSRHARYKINFKHKDLPGILKKSLF